MKKLLVLIVGLLLGTGALAQFDQNYAAWDSLVKKHVKWLPDNKQSRADYAGFKADRAEVKKVLDGLSAVPRSEFDGWSKPQRMAFLINAYNAYTVELVLTQYPALKSIKDIGSLIQSPWKKMFFPLFGKATSLDDIEQSMLRLRGAYDDPRIHFALNCASIGCPMLREEAYVAERLDAQLNAQAERFMSDRSRNRYNAASGELEVSKIFDWYGDDFKLGHQGIASVAAFMARYAVKLTDVPAEQDKLRTQAARVAFLDYDWRLNDAHP